MKKVDSSLDWEFSENTLIAVDNLVVGEDLRSAKNVTFDSNGCLFDVEIPILD